jgi:hypothetical protein
MARPHYLGMRFTVRIEGRINNGCQVGSSRERFLAVGAA